MSAFIDGKFTERIRIKEFPIKLDLGCGKTTKEGCIGMDMLDFGQEILWNLENGIPLPDDSVEYIHSSHFVEHLTESLIEKLFLEMTRILKNDGIIDMRCPSDKTIIKYYTSHFSLWNEDRVRGIVQGWNYGNGTFEILELRDDGIELHFKLKFNK
jgi:hypothetical protein